MRCPICHLENPPEAMKCDCGYNFETNRKEERIRASSGRVMIDGSDPTDNEAEGKDSLCANNNETTDCL